MKKSTKIIAASTIAAGLVFGSALSASALMGGYRDCSSGQVVKLTSQSIGTTAHYYNGKLAFADKLTSIGWRSTMTAPAINSFEMYGSPLYSGSTSCAS